MKIPSLLFVLFLFLFASTAASQAASVYIGKVGNSKIRVQLTYHQDGTVSGNYVSFKSGKVYRLSGNNFTQGKLFLTESTQGKDGVWRATSNSTLRKSVVKGKIRWSGTMKNFDGRNVKFSFTKQ